MIKYAQCQGHTPLRINPSLLYIAKLLIVTVLCMTKIYDGIRVTNVEQIYRLKFTHFHCIQLVSTKVLSSAY